MSNIENDSQRLIDLLKQRTLETRVRALLHRWYAFYERDAKNFDHQFELLADDFVIIRPPESDFESVQGKEAYRKSLRGIPFGQESAHWFETLEVTPATDASLKAVVSHRYHTRDPARRGAALLRYDLRLVDDGSLLPRLTSLQESVVHTHEELFRDAYGENRAASFVFYWLSVLERMDGRAEPLRELFPAEFEMHLSSGDRIHTWHHVTQWIAGQAAQVRMSAHRLKNLAVHPGPDDSYEVSMEFLWEGITETGQALIAHTKHDWVLLERGGRYPLLKTFRVRALKPFTPVSIAEALAHGS